MSENPVTPEAAAEESQPAATPAPAIDAVVAWVDGGDLHHRAKRQRYLPSRGEATAVERVAAAERRFSDNDEIRYCLRSLRNHAPWLRTIWLVTDGQQPQSVEGSIASRSGIEVVDHREIFTGLEALLPTFNSLSIETLLWRVPGLARHFVYFNDDMFLARAACPEDFFEDGRAVLRGRWGSLAEAGEISFHDQNRRNGVKLTGWNEDRYFAAAHVAHPMRTDVLEELWRDRLPDFARNAAFRFRNRSQFWPVSAHDHHALLTDRATVYARPKRDWLHFSVKFCRTGEPAEIEAKLKTVADHKVLLSCVNFIEQVASKVPNAMGYLDAATGRAQPFERAAA